MNGQMKHQPPLISSLIMHGARHHAEREVVSRGVEGAIHGSLLVRQRPMGRFWQVVACSPSQACRSGVAANSAAQLLHQCQQIAMHRVARAKALVKVGRHRINDALSDPAAGVA